MKHNWSDDVGGSIIALAVRIDVKNGSQINQRQKKHDRDSDHFADVEKGSWNDTTVGRS